MDENERAEIKRDAAEAAIESAVKAVEALMGFCGGGIVSKQQIVNVIRASITAHGLPAGKRSEGV